MLSLAVLTTSGEDLLCGPKEMTESFKGANILRVALCARNANAAAAVMGHESTCWIMLDVRSLEQPDMIPSSAGEPGMEASKDQDTWEQ